ncbi:hypothetical protein HU200_002418 [Digitaria exilis]|uniref:Rx N-terminal domain-containing protein n=1 Tax=Digitaria exilis TaxID=1010633 RepID=A0A835FVL6_9POAL|nr:hypothetical protein HU200_002418 [Digitaria exilis]
MEAALSAISGEILSRLISIIIKKYTKRSCLEEKLEKLQHLLLRVHTVVEEAGGRYITNSKMLVQHRMLVDGMYKGYHVLNTFRLKPFEEGPPQKQVTTSSALSAPLKRTCEAPMKTTAMSFKELQASLEYLDILVSNMTEFVILLGGCKQMHKRPYDTYIYIENFMFSRLVEKQEFINTLLQDNSPVGSPAVIPVIDVDDSEWVKFYSAISHMGASGSKVIITSRFQKVSRFGTVKPILLKSLSDAEFSYLFKALTFGGTDPENHPQLESIAMELAMDINGLLLLANMFAELLWKNQSVQFWFHILKTLRKSLGRNFSMYREHPKQLLQNDRPTDITMLVSPSYAPLRLMPSYDDSSLCRTKLSKVKLGDLVQGSTTILLKEEFQITVWESRIPPFAKFVANCIVDRHPCTSSDNKKHKSTHIQQSKVKSGYLAN